MNKNEKVKDKKEFKDEVQTQIKKNINDIWERFKHMTFDTIQKDSSNDGQIFKILTHHLKFKIFHFYLEHTIHLIGMETKILRLPFLSKKYKMARLNSYSEATS